MGTNTKLTEQDLFDYAVTVGLKSTCNKRKVGCVIVEGKYNIVAEGYNYTTNNEPCEDSDGNTNNNVVHAEDSALMQLAKSNNNNPYTSYTAYVTHKPCDACSLLLKNNGVRVKWRNLSPNLLQSASFMKFDNNKLKYSLIPWQTTEELAKVLTFGASKYAPNNWQKVDDIDRYYDALQRHLAAWRKGEKIDPDSGLPHLSHCLTNVAFLSFLDK